MEMLATVAGLVVALFALLPGVPAEWCYRLLVGIDWREDKWARTLRLLGFSTFGLALYAAVAPLFRAPLPLYVDPILLQKITPADFSRLSSAFLGHVIGSVIVAVLTALAAPLIRRLSKRIAFVTAWDRFINVSAARRWVVVALQSGEVYAGYVEAADTSVAAAERDILLREPARYVEKEGVYRVSEYSALFLVGSSIASVGALSDPKRGDRMITPGTLLFGKEGDRDET
jgi:hypothetical protein